MKAKHKFRNFSIGKLSGLTLLITILFAGRLALDLTGCKHDDQIISGTPGTGSPTYSETELLSVKATAAPSIDGTIDDVWKNAVPLKTRTAVPTIAGAKVPANFYGYHGKSTNVTMRSMYDNENIYFLIEWDDNTFSVDRETWYFDVATKRWKQENRYPTYNADTSIMIRDAFYEDKFAILWNVDNTVADWNNKTCYASCHTGLSAADGYARHYTNGANERIDMWHWKLVREGFFGTFDDQYQDNAYPNGRKSDPKVAGTGYADNKQTLTITGTSTSVSVPKYLIPGRTFYYWITQDEINNGTAKLITAVDANGVLSYNGGTIDPNVETDFQRAGSVSGSKGVPSILNSKVQGNEGDITAKWKFTGSGYVMEVVRKLNTGDTEKVDVNFSSLNDQYFGVGVFLNAALAHSIKTNLVLKFKK